MKKYILTFLFLLLPTSIFAIAGFGLQVAQGQMKVEESVLGGADIPGVTLTNGAFENAFGIGAFLYIDIIPVIDLELDFQAMGNTYDINFENPIGAMDPIPFAWASANTYITVRKDVFSLSIPFLAAAKLYSGLGYNMHRTTPVASIEMVEQLLGGDIVNGDVSNLSKNLEDFLTNKDNYDESSGFHFQAGLQLKLLTFTSQLFYRYTMAEEVVPGKKGFGSMNFRFGFGI